MKTKTFSFITGIFFVLLLIFLVSYLLLLRNQNEIHAQTQFSEITRIYETIPFENNGQEFFTLLETGYPTLLGFLAVQEGVPQIFWGNDSLLVEREDQVVLVAPEVTQELFVRQIELGNSTSAVFRMLGKGEFFLVSRAGLLGILGFFVFSLFGYWIFHYRSRVDKKPQEVVDIPVQTQVSSAVSEPKPTLVVQEPKDASPGPVTEDEQFNTTLVYPYDALEDRLAGELHRAGSNQMDASLGLISSDLSNEHEFQGLLREHFIYKDVLCRENAKSCWVILPQIDLDLGIAEIERFMSMIRRRYATGGDGKNPRKPPVFTCGISSRNGRILGPARLIKEARQALKKTGPEAVVVGFRTNSEQ